MMNEFIHCQYPTFSSQQLVNIVMDDIKLDEKSLGKLQHYKSNIPPNSYRIAYNTWLTFSVGDTIPWFTISIEQDN